MTQTQTEPDPPMPHPPSRLPNPQSITVAEMTAILTAVQKRFLAHDAVLFNERAHERTVTHRVAVYLERELPGWHVDCEYNRAGVDRGPKRDATDRRVFPDIVVHIRDEPRNLLVIEAKPAWASARKQAADREKICRIVRRHHYVHAYLLSYSSGNQATLNFERVELPEDLRAQRGRYSPPLPLP